MQKVDIKLLLLTETDREIPCPFVVSSNCDLFEKVDGVAWCVWE